jgi:hypothetical protein
MPDLHLPRALIEIRGEQVDLLASSPSFATSSMEKFTPFLLACNRNSRPTKPVEGFIVSPFAGDGVGILRMKFAPNQPTRLSLMIVPDEFYSYLPDPFYLQERFPTDWAARSWLDDAIWPEAEIAPRRTVEQLRNLLEHGNGPLLLGSAQAIVDNGRILLTREEPPEVFFRDLWQFLPYPSQRLININTLIWDRLWIDQPTFELASVPEPLDPMPYGWLDDDTAMSYPESRYERDLQVAIEMGEQGELDQLLQRRTSAQTFSLGLMLVLGMIGVLVLMKLVG